MKLRSNLLVSLVSFLGGLEAADVDVLVVDCDSGDIAIDLFVQIDAFESCFVC